VATGGAKLWVLSGNNPNPQPNQNPIENWVHRLGARINAPAVHVGGKFVPFCGLGVSDPTTSRGVCPFSTEYTE